MRAFRVLATVGLLLAVGCGGATSVSLRSGKVYFHKNKDYPKAEEWFREAVAENPADYEGYLYLALSLAEQGKFKEAGDTFKQAYDLAPDQAKKDNVDQNRQHYYADYFNRGVSANSIMNYQDAASEFEKAVALDPTKANGYVNLAYAYSMTGQNERALEALKIAVEMEPTSVEAWRNLGVTYQTLKQHDLASQAFEKVVALKPDDSEAFFSLGDMYFNSKENEKALQNYLKAAEIIGEDAALEYQIGQVYYRLEKFSEASLAFQKAAALSKDKDRALYLDAMYNLGVGYLRLQDYDGAISIFEKLVGEQETAEVHEMLGTAYSKKGMKDKAMEEFKKMSELEGTGK